jgi:hypothetical protein
MNGWLAGGQSSSKQAKQPPHSSSSTHLPSACVCAPCVDQSINPTNQTSKQQASHHHRTIHHTHCHTQTSAPLSSEERWRRRRVSGQSIACMHGMGSTRGFGESGCHDYGWKCCYVGVAAPCHASLRMLNAAAASVSGINQSTNAWGIDRRVMNAHDVVVDQHTYMYSLRLPVETLENTPHAGSKAKAVAKSLKKGVSKRKTRVHTKVRDKAPPPPWVQGCGGVLSPACFVPSSHKQPTPTPHKQPNKPTTGALLPAQDGQARAQPQVCAQVGAAPAEDGQVPPHPLPAHHWFVRARIAMVVDGMGFWL